MIDGFAKKGNLPDLSFRAQREISEIIERFLVAVLLEMTSLVMPEGFCRASSHHKQETSYGFRLTACRNDSFFNFCKRLIHLVFHL